MRILVYSNAPWAPSGYGTQTAQLLRRLKAAGHTVAVASNYGIQGKVVKWEDIEVFPAGYDGHSRDVLLANAVAFAADWILTLYDVFVLSRDEYRDVRVASWVPVDSDPPGLATVNWCKEHFPIAMSRFGERALKAEGVDARYAPHAIELDTYKPTPSDLRAQFGIPADAFLVLINAANKGNNPPRKAWPEMLEAYAEFARRHDDVWLFINSEVDGVFGLPLGPVMVRHGITSERLRVVPQDKYKLGQISPTHVAGMYTAADVLLSTSMGEGFGLPVLEAQACGLPVIVTDFSAQPELVGAGWTVAYQRSWHGGHQSFWATPLIPDIVHKLEAAYAARGDQSLRDKAIAFAQDYDADKVFDTYWRPILAEMEALLAPKAPRRVRRQKAKRR